MKKAITLTMLSLFTLVAHAQHFDWVKTYTGPDLNGSETNNIVGSFVDAEGNFYFLGEFSPSATLCGIRLLPHEVVSEQYKSVVVAKLSPSGQLMWHKAIYGPQSSYAYSFCPMGDTAFMVMVGFKMSHNFNSFLYYLDTLLTSSNVGYLQSYDSTASPLTNGFITFRLDGSVAEQHFIELGYIDSTGRPLTIGLYGQPTPAPDALESTVLSSETLTIDNDGNIYIARLTKDYKYILNERFSIDDGTIATYKIMVDGSHPLLYPLEQPSALWNQQILKFSPHFDSLLATLFVFDGTTTIQGSVTAPLGHMRFDSIGNLYVLTGTNTNLQFQLQISNSNSLHYNATDYQTRCIIKYSPDFTATDMIQFGHTEGTSNNVNLPMSGLIIDNSTNSMFIAGNSHWPLADSINVLYLNDTIRISNKSAFWLRLNLSDYSLLSYGQAKPTSPESSVVTCYSISNGGVNRLFGHTKYSYDMAFADTAVYAPSSQSYGNAYLVWDYDGHEIAMIDYQSYSIDNVALPACIKDSSVYFAGSINADATFDTFHCQTNGISSVYIAKYTDSNLIRPYLYIDPRVNQTIEWTQLLSFSILDEQIQLTATSTSGLPITYTIEDTAIAIIRNDTLFLRSEGFTQITASQSGNSAFYPAEPVTRLLQVGRESVDVSNESKIHIYPNPAKDVLYFVCDETTISEITVLSSDGRMTKLPYNSNSIDISTLSTGIYYLVIVSEHEVYKHKIVKL